MILFSSSAVAQERYWVFFSDKDHVKFDPFTYFDERTIQKRINAGVSLTDFYDLPVRSDYIEELKKNTGNIHTISRWFNAVTVTVRKKDLDVIIQLPFVVKVIPVEMKAYTTKKPFKTSISSSDEFLRKSQLKSFGAGNFEGINIDGRGIRIAIFDGGFPGVNTSPVFRHLIDDNRIIATWDFVKNREFVYAYSSHGTSVLTCIAGQMDDKKFGLATGAEFLLARTEISREVFSEEENWLAAMEWADKNGADIINSSLGYTFHRYKQRHMDGKTTLVSRAATMAAAKGMLVVNAAGNDGDTFWKVIGAPADSDSILTVGGVNPFTGYKTSFSSLGPTFDGRPKPNISAFGEVTTSNKKKITKSYGTSFSSPLVAGFAACVMQMNPEWDNMKVYHEIQKSGHLYPYFDYAHGYGVPQAGYFTGCITEPVATFFFAEDNDSIHIVFIKKENMGENHNISFVEETLQQTPDNNENKNVDIETKGCSRFNFDDNFMYFHIAGRSNKNMLRRFAVVKTGKKSGSFTISKNEINDGVLRVFYQGFVDEFSENVESLNR